MDSISTHQGDFGQKAIDALPNWMRARLEPAIQARDVTGIVRALRPAPLQRIGTIRAALCRFALYEPVLVKAYRAAGTYRDSLPVDQAMALFSAANPEALRGCGDPLPMTESFELFRGVSGREPGRKQNGLSWTDDRSRACWFALQQFAEFEPVEPAVYSATVKASAVLVFTHDEREFIILPPPTAINLELTPDEIRHAHDEHEKTIRVG